MYYQNVRGLRSKTIDFFNNIVCNDYDVIVLSETWLNNSIFDLELFDNRYIVYRRDRETTGFHSFKNGGGVLIAVAKHLKSKRLCHLESRCEDIWIELQVINANNKPEKLHMCCVYLPPPIQFHILDEFLDNCNRVLDSLDINQFLLLNDFNLGTIPWSSTLPITSSSLYNNMLMDFASLHELTQHNLIRNNKDNILDLILSNITITKLNVSSNPLSLVDPAHPPLEFIIPFSPTTNLPQNFYYPTLLLQS